MTVNSDPRLILIQKRAILTLHLVVKALCSKTFGPDRKMFEQVIFLVLVYFFFEFEMIFFFFLLKIFIK